MTLLEGARVALLEARLASEMAELVRREGGEPVCAPAVYEARVDATGLIPALIDDIRDSRIAIVICLTGAGLTSLFTQANEIGSLASLVSALSVVTTVCRGPKPSAVLRRHAVRVRVGVQSPHTTDELLAALATVPIHGQRVVVVCDGGRNTPLVNALALRGAEVQEIHAYEWQLPADVVPLEQLVHSLLDDRIDAVAFTTQVQVRHLFAVADRLNLHEPLRYALSHRTVVGSIGPSCSAVLEEFGVVPHVVALPPRMRPLITALGAALGARLSAPQHTPGASAT
ncbi:MAG: uroporphyrinogen-III synthase [bacterium]